MLFPGLRKLQSPDYPYMKIHEFVSRTVRGVGAVFLDLSEALKKSGLPTYSVSEFDDHPNEYVHRIAATELFKVITSNGLLPNSISDDSDGESFNNL